MKLPNEVYDILKWIAIIVLPALATLVGAVGVAIGYANTDLVVTIIVALGAFLGSVLGVSSYEHNKEDGNDAK